MLSQLPLELLEIIINKLSYKETKNIFLSSKCLSSLKYKINFRQLINYNKIKHLEYSDNFINLTYLSPDGNIPIQKNKNVMISVRRLIFHDNFNQHIKIIPYSVKHLTFLWDFNHPISPKGFIPDSITHLIFGVHFNQPIGPVGVIPNSVKHLAFGYHFNQPISPSGTIPNSVTHLKFGYKFMQDIMDIPNSVIHLTFSNFPSRSSIGNLPNSIIYLNIHGYLIKKVSK